MPDEDIEVREAKVVFTTKELLERIDSRLERMENAVSAAATRAELDRVEARVLRLEEIRTRQERLEAELEGVRSVTVRMDEFINDLEAVKAHKAAVFTRREKVVGAVIAIAAVTFQVIFFALNNAGLF